MYGDEDRCKHDLLEGQCAICLKHDLGDKEEILIFKGITDKWDKQNNELS